MTRQTVAILPEGQFERKDTTFNFTTVSQLVQTSSSQQDFRGTLSTRRVPVIKRAAVLCSRSRRSALIVPRPLQARDAYFRPGRTQVRKNQEGDTLRCNFLARKSAKLIANFSAKMVTSLPSISLSLYLSLSLFLSISHLTHNIASTSALPIISVANDKSPSQHETVGLAEARPN